MEQKLDDMVARIWLRHLPDTLRLVDEMAACCADWSDESRQRARAAAHKLAGTLPSFGLPEAGELCRWLEEDFLADEKSETCQRVQRVRELIEPGAQPVAQVHLLKEPEIAVVESHFTRRVLLVDDDPAWADVLNEYARHRQLECVHACSLAEARRALARESFDVILLDLELGQERGVEFLKECAADPAAPPVVVVSLHGATLSRIEVARSGARGFLQKPLQANAVLDEVCAQIERREERRYHVLLVDDDETMRDILACALDELDVRLTATCDVEHFWECLESTNLDLIVLDLGLPQVDGLELLRALRNESRFMALPVMVMTARDDDATLDEAYRLGADDFIAKPFQIDRIRSRMRSRLERSKTLRELSELDALTGLLNRRRALQMITQFLHLARRQNQPLSVAVIDVDFFKKLNDNYGHHVGDQVLRRLAEELRKSFRSEDVLARWGGEEFVVAMFGVGLVDAVFRLAQFLESFSQMEIFPDQRGAVTFSAGMAESSELGETFQTLYLNADNALYQAKLAGRNRVIGYASAPTVWADPGWSAPLARATAVALLERRGFVLVEKREEAQLHLPAAFKDQELESATTFVAALRSWRRGALTPPSASPASKA